MASHSRSLYPIHFLKIIPKSTLETIMIPKSFREKYGGCLPNPVFLKPPDGKEWEVHWTKNHDNEFWFQKGWKEFCSFYSLGFGHLVRFKFEATSKLDVLICAPSASEIDYPFHDSSSAQKHGLNNKISDENVIEISDDDMPQTQKARPKTTLPSSKMRDVTRQDVKNRSSNLQNLNVFQKSPNAELTNYSLTQICSESSTESLHSSDTSLYSPGASSSQSSDSRNHVKVNDTATSMRSIKQQNSLVCHQCMKKERRVGISCTRCEQKLYCVKCIKRWYPNLSEEEIAECCCPFCRKICNCKVCLRSSGMTKPLSIVTCGHVGHVGGHEQPIRRSLRMKHKLLQGVLK